jgi:hypothetical protein
MVTDYTNKNTESDVFKGYIRMGREGVTFLNKITAKQKAVNMRTVRNNGQLTEA